MVCQITYLNAANFRSNEFLYEKQQNCNAIVLGTHISVCADHFIFNISSSLNHSLTIFGMAAGAVTPQFNSSSSTDTGNFRQNFTKQISISIRTIFPPQKKPAAILISKQPKYAFVTHRILNWLVGRWLNSRIRDRKMWTQSWLLLNESVAFLQFMFRAKNTQHKMFTNDRFDCPQSLVYHSDNVLIQLNWFFVCYGKLLAFTYL